MNLKNARLTDAGFGTFARNRRESLLMAIDRSTNEARCGIVSANSSVRHVLLDFSL